MRINRYLPVGLYLVLLGPVLLASCTNKPGVKWQPKTETLSPPPPLVWTVTVTPPGAKDDSIFFRQYPEDRLIYSGPAKEILAYWGNGFLFKGEKGFEWRDFDPSAAIFNPNPALDLISWDTPIAVDAENKLIFAFGNAVAPNRKIQVHYLNGNEPLTMAEVQMADAEALTPLPINGWPIFYADKPEDKKDKKTDEVTPGRRVRVYSGPTFAGEMKDTLAVYPLQDCVAVEKKDGWMLFQRAIGVAVPARTMSLSLVPDHPRPVAKLGDLILVASDKLGDDGKTVAATALYSYGIYTRMVEKIWEPPTTGSPQTILAMAVQGSNDYIIVLGSLPDQKKLTLGRLKDGKWEELAKVDLPNKVTRTEVFLLSEKPEPVETTQGSGAEPESTVKSEGSVVNGEVAIEPGKVGKSDE